MHRKDYVVAKMQTVVWSFRDLAIQRNPLPKLDIQTLYKIDWESQCEKKQESQKPAIKAD